MALVVLLGISLGLNLVLAFGWLLAARNPTAHKFTVMRPARLATNVVRGARTNIILSPQLFSWSQLESDDYPTYIANLRGIGCPEATIRDIIVADVNQVFARRRATGIVSVTQQWWRTDPDLDVLEEAADKAAALEKERRSLLAALLGDNWEATADRMGIPELSVTFDGPHLAALSAETKQTVRDVELHARERTSAYRRAMEKEGKLVDPAELARYRQQTREELAKVLAPAELEEYLLRYSHNADNLREALRGFEPSAEEFRSLFRATDPVDVQLQALAGRDDKASLKQREELERQREEAIRRALKGERYEFYRLNRDPLFQQARETAEQVGVAAESVLPLYEINHAVEQERQRVLNNASLTTEEQTRELANIYQHRLDSLRKLLGEEAFKKYQDTVERP